MLFLLTVSLTAANYLPAKPTKAPAPAAFTEGIITTRVSLPGNPFDKVLSQLDPAKGNPQEQMQRIIGAMSPAEQQQMQASAQKSPPAMTMGAMMLPRKGTIYCRNQEARVSTDALTYHLENYFNSTKNTGLLLMAAQGRPDQVAYTYDAGSVKNVWQSISVTDADYTMKTTAETALVAGYPSTKTTYTLKPNAAAPADPALGGMSEKPVALDVWTSPQIPQMLNFAHPVYVKEKQGITKLVVYFDKERKHKLLYEFESVQLKPVTAQNLQIKTTGQVLDYAKDITQIGAKTLAIMFAGGPQRSGKSTDE
ncbi:hypothetical protein [Hymenobacter volaticus]|uniref:Outer membrane lipoprotein-sorting protein n=1 Tax=Hymenobacter volaticus TaxID=2932254 RepID=A0ABY4G1N0_9BACT|nr:hypothetical protein [Hymenobacter volaticus]UOQ64728.1 hypothetical protein MUN86_14250 [Hymenobacter volaticus]